MSDLKKTFDGLKDGLTYSKSRNAFYEQFVDALGKYPSLALLSLMSRSQVQINELKLIAYIVSMYPPISIHKYNLDCQEKPNLCLAGKVNEHKVYFDMQFAIPNPETNRDFHPDLKVTVVETHLDQECEMFSIAIEYEGHSSHTDPNKVKGAFLRNREISYQLGGPVLPYYKEEVDNKENREQLLRRLSEFIDNKIERFEDVSVFKRKKYNATSRLETLLVACPLCKGGEKLGDDFCPVCKGGGRVPSCDAEFIDVSKYTEFNCPDCFRKGCVKCGFSGVISLSKAISIAFEDS
ncbi:hypothetical protein [Vibrio sp. Vb2201]|uniref:hypothetical protein n=1 Tax=Vibrio sp. Vb2201 TaxID=3074655 RepID=UPI002965224E|nr:hypothetical protein [Vibrio sp. Vb2201]MDW1798979.1 hypothetical protein [Vibrio sp. Vb2201]